MNRYAPSETPTDIQSVAYIRQNPWKKCPNGVLLLRNNKLHLPWAHDYNAVRRFQENGEVVERWSKVVAELPVNCVAYIPGEYWGCLVRIKSEVKAGLVPNVYVVRDAKTCQHPYIIGACDVCKGSILEVTNGDPLPHLEKGHILEPFWSLYREIEVMGNVQYNRTVKKGDLARVDSAGLKHQYWTLQE